MVLAQANLHHMSLDKIRNKASSQRCTKQTALMRKRFCVSEAHMMYQDARFFFFFTFDKIPVEHINPQKNCFCVDEFLNKASFNIIYSLPLQPNKKKKI